MTAAIPNTQATATQSDTKININQYNSVKISTSIDRISASLGYLAQCDYITGNNGDSLTSDAQFGRGYLLDMLGDGVAHFAKNFEQFENLHKQQQQQIDQLEQALNKATQSKKS